MVWSDRQHWPLRRHEKIRWHYREQLEQLKRDSRQGTYGSANNSQAEDGSAEGGLEIAGTG